MLIMANRPATHRASGLARREALLRATVEIVAERGIGGATHRAIASRAGVPLSTTSYFFGSLEEMITEALQGVVERSVARMNALVERLVNEPLSRREVVERYADVLLAIPRSEVVAQFEAYLDASRRSELEQVVHGVLASFEEVARRSLAAEGVERPEEAARAFVALADGFALARMARPEPQADRRALVEGMSALLVGYLASRGPGEGTP